MLNECILIDTNLITKDDKTYYMVFCYLPQEKANIQVFVNKDTYDYCDELPSYEDISNITKLVYDRKNNVFKLSINVDKI